MRVQEFIEAVKKNPNQATSICKKIIKTRYIPVLQKRQLAELIYDKSTDIENGLIKVDSLSKYLIFTLLMLTTYTELEFSVDENGSATEDAIKEYDALCESGLLNNIIAEFADDYARVNEIVNYVFQDILAVNNTVEAVVGKVALNLLDIMDNLGNILADKVNDMNLDLESLDLGQLQRVLRLLNIEK